MRRTDKTTDRTSFHGETFTASVADLRQIFGNPDSENNDGQDKVNFDWKMETEDGTVFTVYDWKEYRPLKEDEEVEWHVGGYSGMNTEKALNEIADALNNL